MGENHNSRVLIVDDMRVNRMILSSLLASNGVNSDMAESGRECLDLCRKNTYDLILLDHRMPDYDGVETLVMLKEIFKERGREVPVVCHTTEDARKNINLYKAAGFADVLIKPIQPQELSEIVMTYLPEGKNAAQEKLEKEKEKRDKEISELPAWLKEVDGLDLESGIEHCETAEDYLDALEVFAGSIQEKADEIEHFFKEENLPKYALKVHSLKSMARLVGAEELGELAADLEIAAKNGNVIHMREKTPGLLEMYRGFSPVLNKYFAGEEEEVENANQKEASEETIKDAYTAIAEFAFIYDSDSIHMVLESLKAYRLPAEDAERVKKIAAAVSGMEWETLREIMKNR